MASCTNIKYDKDVIEYLSNVLLNVTQILPPTLPEHLSWLLGITPHTSPLVVGNPSEQIPQTIKIHGWNCPFSDMHTYIK